MIITLPNLGDGINSATVLSILVKPGDKIDKNQTILELETDKATAPIPASEAGIVEKILIKEGDTVSAGTPVLSLSGGPSTPSQQPSAPPSAVTPPQPTPAASVGPQQASGYIYTSASGQEPPAPPSIRKIARELGIDLTRVQGTEPGGRITLADVKAYIEMLQYKVFQEGIHTQPGHIPVLAQAEPKPTIDFSKWGDISKKPISSLRKKIGQKMTSSWTTVPHVTQFDTADITELMELRKAFNQKLEKKGIKLTVTVFALKAAVEALKKFPLFNASFDEANGDMIYKNYYHIGVAVDTDNGLIVPVIKDVDKKDIVTLSEELNILADKARKRQIGLEDLQGGTFTISNLGGLGVSHFTPIINTPEVAIMALSAGRLEPVVINKKIEPRMILPIGISYDHRIIDGADGARFTRELVAHLEKPSVSL